MSKLYHIVTNNIKNKYQCNDAIEYVMNLNNEFCLSSGTKDPRTVLTVSLRGGNKHRETIISGLTCMWDSGATGRIIKSLNTKNYERKMCSNKVEYITAIGPYCTTHDVKVQFWMPEFSSIKIILQLFHVDKNEGESGIGYDMIIGYNLMEQHWLFTNFKHKVLQWDGVTVLMKNPLVF